MGIRDWLGGRGARATTWQVRRDGGDVVLEDDRGAARRYPLEAAHSVRVVPLTGGDHHRHLGGGRWQVTLKRADGDVLIASALGDWRAARALAQQVCDASGLPLDEMTARLFSQTGLPKP